MKRVVLVRPSGPRNVGAVARASANFGPCEVVLVAPERRSILLHPDFEQMSHGVSNLSEKCVVVATLEEALADCTSSIGFTVRSRQKRACADWRAMRESASEACNDADRLVALVFGNEVTGLTDAETALVQELATIRTSTEHRSLNLGTAVSIVLCDLFAGDGVHLVTRRPKSLSGEGRQFLKDSLKHVFAGKIARSDAARRDITASIDRVFSRAALEDRDARAWHLILRALGNELTPKELGIEMSRKKGRRAAELERVRAKAKAPASDASRAKRNGAGDERGARRRKND